MPVSGWWLPIRIDVAVTPGAELSHPPPPLPPLLLPPHAATASATTAQSRAAAQIPLSCVLRITGRMLAGTYSESGSLPSYCRFRSRRYESTAPIRPDQAAEMPSGNSSMPRISPTPYTACGRLFCTLSDSDSDCEVVGPAAAAT